MSSKHETLAQFFLNVGPPSATLAQHLKNIGLIFRVFWVIPSATDTCKAKRVKVEIAISTNPKPTIYRTLYENTGLSPKQTHIG